VDSPYIGLNFSISDFINALQELKTLFDPKSNYAFASV